MRTFLCKYRHLEQIVSLAYKVIKMIVRGNKKSVRRAKKIHGISIMLKHRLGSTSSWAPPIDELLKANAHSRYKKVGIAFESSGRLVKVALEDLYQTTMAHMHTHTNTHLYAHINVHTCTPSSPSDRQEI